MAEVVGDGDPSWHTTPAWDLKNGTGGIAWGLAGSNESAASQILSVDGSRIKTFWQRLLDNDFDGAHPVSGTGKQENINRDLRGGRGVATTRSYQECFRNAVDSTAASLHTAIESFCMGVDSCLISRDLPSDWIATQVLRVIEYHNYTMTTGAYRQTTTRALLDNDFDGAHPVSETGKQESINRDLRGGRGVATTRPYQECFRNAVDSTTASLHTAIESFCMGVDSCLISRDLPSDWIATQVLRVIEYHSYTMTTGAYRQTTTRAYGFVDPILPDPGQIINLGLR
ncbi:hypothetical protein B0O80DRAFT_502942 [Mortierella sp. GBAus27b]|nr:hypothetical protein B0O80DRAFT_502942 [Mortierella sp. GBAus27b]